MVPCGREGLLNQPAQIAAHVAAVAFDETAQILYWLYVQTLTGSNRGIYMRRAGHAWMETSLCFQILALPSQIQRQPFTPRRGPLLAQIHCTTIVM